MSSSSPSKPSGRPASYAMAESSRAAQDRAQERLFHEMLFQLSDLCTGGAGDEPALATPSTATTTTTATVTTYTTYGTADTAITAPSSGKGKGRSPPGVQIFPEDEFLDPPVANDEKPDDRATEDVAAEDVSMEDETTEDEIMADEDEDEDDEASPKPAGPKAKKPRAPRDTSFKGRVKRARRGLLQNMRDSVPLIVSATAQACKEWALGRSASETAP